MWHLSLSNFFIRVQKHGPTLLVTTDPELMKYLNNVVEQLKDWLYKCSVQTLVVVILNIESEVLKRWQCDVECDKTAKDDRIPREKSQKAVHNEILSVIRQITATLKVNYSLFCISFINSKWGKHYTLLNCV